ncbi:hypothetical protein Pla52o_47140 [Novipirellula galeiformis]|uniref:Uncharacterized protein n=1 Tax=Novipirellula galeiformis TaxID=2528004 RepID=A0A5C6CBK2_9BACT|nr:hypothetical protein [Novipirellula galeiformis]TWU20199.1 hypothetical protein Pla52o_47140 [Novipirellula galeiformis]
MKWRMLLAVVLGLSVSYVATFAQSPPEAERLSLGRASPQPDTFFSASGVVQFQLIQGRLGLNPPRHRKGAQQRSGEDGYERIIVTAVRGIPSLHYVSHRSHSAPPVFSQSPAQRAATLPSGQHLTLSVQEASDVKIDSEWLSTGERCVLHQPEFGMIRWEITRGADTQTYRGTTLFHLRLQDPLVFDLHYGNLISRVLRGESLAELSDQIHASVLSDQFKLPQIGLDDVARCAEQLRSPRQGVRMSAQRQLLSWGTPVIPMLQQVLATDFDLEQQTRVIETLRMLRPRVDDTPRSLAMLMVNDREFWSLAKARLSEHQWIAVKQHLQQVGLPVLEAGEQPVSRVARQSP